MRVHDFVFLGKQCSWCDIIPFGVFFTGATHELLECEDVIVESNVVAPNVCFCM